MLANPEWDKKTFSKEGLVDWLYQQPVDGEYSYSSQGDCLLARYFTEAGYEHVSVNTISFSSESGSNTLPQGFDEVAQQKPWSYAGALKRVKELV